MGEKHIDLPDCFLVVVGIAYKRKPFEKVSRTKMDT